jgi:predicted Zn-dependent protease
VGPIRHSASARVYVTEVFEGYDGTTELNAIRLAVEWLKRAGYDPMALHASSARLLAARNDYVSNGHFSSLLVARPGLEERMMHAKSAAEALK